jgi:GT2 family glycosyltransferase
MPFGSRTPVVDFVVCSRNNRDIIGSTLEAISRQTVRDFTCTVVDGRSTDGTAAFVRERFPWVEVVVKDEDDGPSRSRNIGWRRGSAPLVVLVDSDVTLEPAWTETQIRLVESDDRIGIVGGKLLYSRQPELLYAAYGAMSRYGIGWDGGRAEPEHHFTEVRPCLWINSSAMMLRRQLLNTIGGFDDAMFLGCEDADLGWRANLFGWRVLFNPAASAMHEVHGTLDPKAMSARLVHLIWRNRLRSALVNYEPGSLLRYTAVFTLLSAVDAVLRAPRLPKLAALWWNIRRLADTWSRRHWVQRHRVLRDRDLWPLFCFGLRGPGYGFRPRALNGRS